MYTKKYFDYLTSKYGGVGSWAVWDYNDQSDVTVVEKNFNQLNVRYVLLALNISKNLPRYWSNFHEGPSNVRKIKYACNDTVLRGSYITDLFKNIVESNSQNLKKLLTEEIIEENVMFFKKEMEDIGIDENTKFVILGTQKSDVAKYFNLYFRNGFKNQVIYHRHYASRGTDRDWVTGLWKRLELNEDFDQARKKYKSKVR